jgi:HPr kinase/phosphorylase
MSWDGEQARLSASGYVHATAVLIGDAGVLIRGESGAGKSSLALALIQIVGQAHFARLIGDDRVRLQVRGDRLIVSGHPAIAGQIERFGQGIARLPHEDAAVVRLIVDLTKRDLTPRLPESDSVEEQIFGVVNPRLVLSSGRLADENARLIVNWLEDHS